MSLGLAEDKQLEHHEELPQRFKTSPVTMVSSSADSASEDSDTIRIPDPEDSAVVQAATGNGFQVLNEGARTAET
jgi:hypothetical protein